MALQYETQEPEVSGAGVWGPAIWNVRFPWPRNGTRLGAPGMRAMTMPRGSISRQHKGTRMRKDLLREEKVVVGAYTNYGNRLIERSIFKLLHLPETTPRFSVFERISDELLEFINGHDYVVITGCTTLQDDPGHQRCFDAQFERIRSKKICFGASFYCEADESPSLRIARLYDPPIGVRDPWTAIGV